MSHLVTPTVDCDRIQKHLHKLELEQQAALLAEASAESDDLRRLLDELRLELDKKTEELKSVEHLHNADGEQIALIATEKVPVCTQTEDADFETLNSKKSGKRKHRMKARGAVLAGVQCHWRTALADVLSSPKRLLSEHDCAQPWEPIDFQVRNRHNR